MSEEEEVSGKTLQGTQLHKRFKVFSIYQHGCVMSVDLHLIENDIPPDPPRVEPCLS